MRWPLCGRPWPSPERYANPRDAGLDDAADPGTTGNTGGGESDVRRYLQGTCVLNEKIYVTIPGSPDDPRTQRSPEGVVIDYVPELHPNDITTLPSGLRVTTVACTLVD